MRYRQWLHSCKCGISSRPVNFSKLNIKSKTEEQPLLSAVIYDHLGCHRVPLLISLSLISLPIICKSLWTVGKKESGKNKRRVLNSVAKEEVGAADSRLRLTMGIHRCELSSAISPGCVNQLHVTRSNRQSVCPHIFTLVIGRSFITIVRQCFS